ncbi:MAG: TonB-dependent receptor [Parabacteroides sp.]|nr:TonB-dependent receptor [Parabacteroides sp.]
MKRIYIIPLVLLPFSAYSQYSISGNIHDKNNETLQNVSVLLFSNDSLVTGTISDKKGKFELKDLPASDYHIQYLSLGYKKEEEAFHLSDNVYKRIILQEDTIALNQVVVDADRSDLVKMEAGSTTFYLSERIKSSSKNVYEALREIPALNVDVSNRKIYMNNGSSPLILINGIQRNDFYEMLDPKNIEAVEVIDNPSAKYRGGEGNITVLNLRVKRTRDVHQYANLFNKQYVNLKFALLSGAYGIETEKFSFKFDVQDFYTNRKGEIKEWNKTDNLKRDYSGKTNNKGNSFYTGISGDWVISDRDYLSYGAAFCTNPSDYSENREGFAIEKGNSQPLSVLAKSEKAYQFGNYNVFYRHTFENKSFLDATLAYGHHNQGPDGWRREESPLYSYYNEIDMRAKKHYMRAELNYDFKIPDKLAFNFGSKTYYQDISIKDTEGKFPYKETREYIYGDIKNINNSKFSYMFSLGLDMVFRNSNSIHENYINILPSFSLSYRFRENDALRLNANRTRVSPGINQMNPRITTTDSLNILVGNPYLKPVISNSARLSYSLNAKKLYFEPYIQYTYTQDNVILVGKLDGNIYRSTYENGENSQFLQTGVTANLPLGKLGSISVTPYFQKTTIDEMSYDGKSWGISTFMFLTYKKVSFDMMMFYTQYQYERASRSSSTPMLEATLTWNLPKGWALIFGLRDNAKKSKTWFKDGGYSSYSRAYYKYESWAPIVGFSYTFRNTKKKRNTQYRSGSDIDGFSIGVH